MNESLMAFLDKNAVQAALRALQSDPALASTALSATFSTDSGAAQALSDTSAQAYAEAFDDARAKAKVLAQKMGVSLGGVRSVTELTDASAVAPGGPVVKSLRVTTLNGKVAIAVTFGGSVPILVVGMRQAGPSSDPRGANALSATFDVRGRTYPDAARALSRADEHFRAVVGRFGARPQDIVITNTYSNSCCL
jgi:hypothetical protein